MSWVSLTVYGADGDDYVYYFPYTNHVPEDNYRKRIIADLKDTYHTFPDPKKAQPGVKPAPSFNPDAAERNLGSDLYF